MNTDHFCSDFVPYEYAIVNIVTLALANGWQGDKTGRGRGP